MNTEWTKLPYTAKQDRSPRRVGVEIELQGIEIERLAELVAASLGGSVRPVSKAEYYVDVESQGAYRVEVDLALLKEIAKEANEDEDSMGLKDMAVDLLGSASSVLVPCEIVAPPIPSEELAEPMDTLVTALRDFGAKGTRHSFLYAFGVHLNVEPPDLEASTILAYLRSFVCLYPWIVEEGEVDLSRRLTPFIDPYDDGYSAILLDPDYRPGWDRLIDDYLSYNPTRDRALDMLPMFAHIDEPRVRRVVDDTLVNARPTFHYRLANSCVDEPGWSIAQPWNRWVRIEELAANRDKLATVAERFVANRALSKFTRDKLWAESIRRDYLGTNSG